MINYKFIHQCLLEIRSGDRLVQFGLCTNLLLKVKSTQSKMFMHEAICKLYGRYDPYLIEGNRERHLGNLDKFDKNTEYGSKRLRLLDALIKHAEDNIK